MADTNDVPGPRDLRKRGPDGLTAAEATLKREAAEKAAKRQQERRAKQKRIDDGNALMQTFNARESAADMKRRQEANKSDKKARARSVSGDGYAMPYGYHHHKLKTTNKAPLQNTVQGLGMYRVLVLSHVLANNI